MNMKLSKNQIFIFLLLVIMFLLYKLYSTQPKSSSSKESSSSLSCDSVNLKTGNRYVEKRPEKFSEICHICDTACDTDCDVCCQLPYHAHTGILLAHHGIAENWKFWNEADRFKNLPLESNSLVLYVGANTNGTDGSKILQICPECEMHIFEPVPDYNKVLEEIWNTLNEENDWSATIHKYGLGNNDRTVKLSRSELLGEGTFGMTDKKNEDEPFVNLKIREASKIIREISNNGFVDLLHVNCEGCEWEMMENIIENNIISDIGSIQLGTHYFPEIEDISSRYCNLRKQLRKTHQMVYGESWSWERWDLI